MEDGHPIQGATTMMTTTCPSPELLTDYALGRVSAEALEQLAAHADQCPDCQARLETMDGVDDTFVAKLRQPLPPDLASQDQELESLIALAEAIPLDSMAKAAVSKRAAGVAAPDAEPPATLGQYVLLSRCGQGGMGAVYKAMHTRLKRLVAVKILPPQRLADPQAVARFQREMEAVGRLNHPNIVQAMDANEVDGQHFLVTEFVDGVNLSRLVRSGSPLPIPDACEIVRQAALGLQHAHDHDLIHRDVKPSNLMLTSAGIVKLLDLGLARLRPELPVEGDMTASGQIMGSADYMAPEQCLDARDVDARADIYSLGCTLYCLLTGRRPSPVISTVRWARNCWPTLRIWFRPSVSYAATFQQDWFLFWSGCLQSAPKIALQRRRMSSQRLSPLLLEPIWPRSWAALSARLTRSAMLLLVPMPNFLRDLEIADESALSAHLLQPVELGRVQAAYRDVMHAQARDLRRGRVSPAAHGPAGAGGW